MQKLCELLSLFLFFPGRNVDRPFLLFFSMAHIHTPLFRNPAFAGKSLHGLYGDNIAEVDWMIGELTLKQGLTLCLTLAGLCQTGRLILGKALTEVGLPLGCDPGPDIILELILYSILTSFSDSRENDSDGGLPRSSQQHFDVLHVRPRWTPRGLEFTSRPARGLERHL